MIQDPVHISSRNKVIDNVFVSDVLAIEISFELKLNEVCSAVYCQLFHIGQDPFNWNPHDQDPIRIPSMSLNGVLHSFHVTFSVNPFWITQSSVFDPYLNRTMVDGDYHQYYFKFPFNQRVFTFDNIVYINETNDYWDSSESTEHLQIFAVKRRLVVAINYT
eukprot:449614_1